MLTHKDGAFLVAGWQLPEIPLPDQPHLVGRYMQTWGLLKTYGRRYGYRDLLNLDDGDDLDSSELAREELPKQQAKKPHARDLVRKPKNAPKPETEEPVDEPAESEEPKEGPGISGKTSKTLNRFLIDHKFSAGETIKLCEQVTGRHPDELDGQGGEALAIKLLDHLRAIVEERK